METNYYREPFTHSTNKVHFRIFSPLPAAAIVYRIFIAGDGHSLFAWLGLN